MGSLSDAFFSLLLGWVRGLANSIWGIFTSDRGGFLEWLGKYWIPVCIVLLVIGLGGDFLVWLIRWRPYHVLARRARKTLGIQDEVPGEDTTKMESVQETEPETVWMPLEQPVMTEQDIRDMDRRASSVSDEVLGEYPGMRYEPSDSETRKYDLPTFEPVQEDEQARYQRELREYEAKQAQYLRDMEAYEKKKREAEQAEYERNLDEYQTKRARYELDLAAYQRDKEAYERMYGRPASPSPTESVQGVGGEMEAPAEDGTAKRKRRRADGGTKWEQ